MNILDLVFPKKCLECGLPAQAGKEGRYICFSCLSKVKLAKPICPECEKPSVDGVVHFKCKRKLGLDGLISIWEYDGVIRRAILALKYKFALEIAKELSFLATEKLSAISRRPEATLVPIPLHWYRRNWRGFNQSEEIGKLIAKELGWKFIPDLLIRKKATTPQTELKAEDRISNIKGVFAVNPIYQPSDIIHQPLILFDDIWTTGSTLKEACKFLKRKALGEVWALTLAK